MKREEKKSTSSLHLVSHAVHQFFELFEEIIVTDNEHINHTHYLPVRPGPRARFGLDSLVFRSGSIYN